MEQQHKVKTTNSKTASSSNPNPRAGVEPRPYRRPSRTASGKDAALSGGVFGFHSSSQIIIGIVTAESTVPINTHSDA